MLGQSLSSHCLILIDLQTPLVSFSSQIGTSVLYLLFIYKEIVPGQSPKLQRNPILKKTLYIFSLRNIYMCVYIQFKKNYIYSFSCLSLVPIENTIFLYYFKVFIIFFMCISVLPPCMFVPGAQRSQKRVLDPLKLELQMVVSYLVAGN